MTMKALYPGSFDPITNGHLDIINRACNVFDHLVVGVAGQNEKNSLFTIEERVELVKETLKGTDIEHKVEVIGFSTLLVDFASQIDAGVIVRGLRAVSDFEFEFQMAVMNRKISPNIETMFLMSSDNQQFVSSRFVKEIHRLNGDISQFVSSNVLEKLNKKYNK